MNAQDLKNAILMRAVQGKLVPQDPNDEPASVLLEKIRAEKEQLMKEKKIKKEVISVIYKDPSDNQHYEKVGNDVKCIEDEIPFEIPEGWEWCRLGSCGDFVRGSGIKRNETSSKGIQCVRYGEIYTIYNTSFTHTVSYVPDKLADKCKQASYGDALLTLTGENKTDIAKAIIYLGNERLVIGGDLAVYTNHHFDPLFLAFLLNSPYVNYQKSVVASGDIIVHISAIKLSGILVAIPPLSEQKRIVSAMEEAIPKIDKYGKYQSSLEVLDQGINTKLKKSILQYAIQGKLVPQNPDDEPASVLLERIREEKEQMIKEGKIKRDKNESYIYRGSDNSYYEKFADGTEKCIDEELPFDIPDSWMWCRLSEILEVKGGKRLPKGENFQDIPSKHIYIRVTDMKEHTISSDKIVYISDETYAQIKNYTISSQDLYLTIAGTIGNCGIVPQEFNGMNLTENAVKLTNIRISKAYILTMLQTEYVQNQFTKRTNKVAQPKLAITRILTSLVPLAPENEQLRILQTLESMPKI